LISSSGIECSLHEGSNNSRDDPYQNRFSNHGYIMDNMTLKSIHPYLPTVAY
jgi:hypothetical protein